MNRLRASLFSSVLRQEVAFFDKTRTGELINRLSSDAALLGRSVTENLSDGLRAGAQASIGVGMMVCRPGCRGALRPGLGPRPLLRREVRSVELFSSLSQRPRGPGAAASLVAPAPSLLRHEFLSGERTVGI